MRFQFSDIRRPRRIARLLQREFEALGIKIGLSGAKKIAARLYGYSTYREIEQSVGKGQPSPWDAVPPDHVEEVRRTHQVSVLRDFGLTHAQAGAIIARLKPTASSIGDVGTNPVLRLFWDSVANASFRLNLAVDDNQLVDMHSSRRVPLGVEPESGPWTVRDALTQAGVFRGKEEDGFFYYPFRFQGHEITAQVTMFDERLVWVRLQRPVDRPRLDSIESLRMEGEKDWRWAASQDSGVCLVLGPTSSGKTATRMATISDFRSQGRTVYDLSRWDRTESGLAALRESVSGVSGAVIGFGCIVNEATARLLFDLAMQGNMVVAELHNASIAGAEVALTEHFGISLDDVRSTVKAMVSQRLLHTPCVSCADSDQGSEFECSHCLGSKYSGNAVVSHCAVFRSEDDWNSPPGFKEQQGAFLKDGLRKVALGLTSVEEIERRIIGRSLEAHLAAEQAAPRP